MEQEQQRYERARECVKEFYTHVTIYVLVNIGVFINLLAGCVWWFYCPLLG